MTRRRTPTAEQKAKTKAEAKAAAEAVQRAAKATRVTPSANGHHANGSAKNGQANGSTTKGPKLFDTGISLTDLLKADLPEPKFLIDLILPQGTSILAARPKVGKSWLVLLWAIAIATGESPFAGHAACARFVLYLALEDTRRRLKDRSSKLMAACGWEPSDRLDLRVSWPRASAGGIAAIADWMESHRGGVVIIDTLAKFRDSTGSKGTYEADYAAIGSLKELADAFECSVIVLHHTRKSVSEDPFDEVSGSLGLTGAADATFVIDKDRGDGSGSMFVTGRDIQEQTFKLAFANGLWSLTGWADGIERAERVDPKASKVSRCAKWLVEFIGPYAWPDAEVEYAAFDAGYKPHDLKAAKAIVRKQSPALHARLRGFGGVWWNWMGETIPPDRPSPYQRVHTGETGDTGEKTP